MKGSLFVLALLLFMSCESETYPDIRYTNEARQPVKFWTAEYNCPDGYKLDTDASMSLPSDVRGRTQISSIETPLVTWEHHEFNEYDIRLIKEGRSLEIRNYTQEKIVVKEKNGYISQDGEWPYIKVEIGPRTSGKYKADEQNLKLYNVKNPVWIIEPDKSFVLKKIPDPDGDEKKDKYILGIEPPEDDEEWYPKED